MQITLVARVLRVTETATNLDLLVDDGTGTLEAKLYVDSEEEQNVRMLDQIERTCKPERSSSYFLAWQSLNLDAR